MALTRFLDYSAAVDYIEKYKLVFKKLYITNNLTARKVAENQNIHYDANFQKALLRVLGKKGMGLGGARIGSGQKKKKNPA